MPYSLPDDQQITVSKRELPYDYRMPTMEVATDHYSIGYLIRGDRRIITPTHSYDYHAGDVSLAAPYVYHRTVSQSTEPYESYLIKFSPELVSDFSAKIGAGILEQLTRERICRFAAEDSAQLLRLFDELHEEYQKDVPYREAILQGMLYRLLTIVWEKRQDVPTERFKTELSEPMVRAIGEIEERYAEELRMEQLARELGFSAAYFSRMFKAQLDTSFSGYLADVRIRHVKDQLLNTDRSISEIALDCGYCSGDYLSAQFKQRTGMKPTEFRRGRPALHGPA